MKSTHMSEELINKADKSFLSLALQIQKALAHIDFYIDRFPNISASLAIKHNDLRAVVKTLGSLPVYLAEVIKRWKTNQPRVLSIIGVEIEILNELITTLSVLEHFLEREGIVSDPLNFKESFSAYQDLAEINRKMK